MKMKCRWNLSLAATIIAICLITTATHAQSLNLVLRFRAEFPFSVENTTFPAGEYEVTQPGPFIVTVRNVDSQASAIELVEPVGSSKETDGQPRAVFHRYDKDYFLAVISDGSWQSTYAFGRSKKEIKLAANSPTRQPELVSVLSVLSKPSATTANVSRK
jgi:hypothetical protein